MLNAAVLTTSAVAAAGGEASAPAMSVVASAPVTRGIVARSATTAAVRSAAAVPKRHVVRSKAVTGRRPVVVQRRTIRTTAITRPRTAVAAPRPRAAIRPTASSWSVQLSEAIARIPGYRAGDVRWVTSDAYGSWGTADWYHATVYVSPRIPESRLYDVVVHEWSHLLSVRPYGGDVDAAVQAMSSYYGGSGLTGAERAADCMAIEQGATWTHYTPCADSRWRAGAARLVRGQRL